VEKNARSAGVSLDAELDIVAAEII